MTTEGRQVNYNPICRVDLMLEASMFLLTTALRRIFIEGLFDDLIDKATWRLKLNLFEHRYHDAGGVEIPEHQHRA